MKFILLVIISLGMLVGCDDETVLFEPTVNDEFRPYIDDFRRYYVGIWPPKLSIVFGQPNSAIATCDSNGSLYTEKIILIRQTAWLGLQPEQRRATIFHELGHCVLNRTHESKSSSYMFPDVMTEQFYSDNKDQLIKELF